MLLQARVQRRATAVLQFGDGSKIVYYANTQQFEATCCCDGHGLCRKTRTSRPGRRSAQGRPLGFLVAWLVKARTFHGADARARHFGYTPALRERQLARAECLGNLLAGGGAELLVCEGEKRDMEESGPEDAP